MERSPFWGPSFSAAKEFRLPSGLTPCHGSLAEPCPGPRRIPVRLRGGPPPRYPSLEEQLDDQKPTRAWEHSQEQIRQGRQSCDLRAVQQAWTLRPFSCERSQNHHLGLEPPRQRSRF